MPNKSAPSSGSGKEVQKDQKDYVGKDLWNRWVSSLEWKAEGVIDGESENRYCNEVKCARQEKSEQDEVDRTKKGADSTGKVMHK